MNIIICNNQNASTPRLPVCGNRHSVVDVQWTISRQRGSQSHSGGHHDRLFRASDQGQKVGGLFKGIGTVSDDNAIHTTVFR